MFRIVTISSVFTSFLVTMVTDCPIIGQERSDCAPPCNTTCRCLSVALLIVLLMVVNALRGVLSMRRPILVLLWRIALRVSCCDYIRSHDLIADSLTCPNVTGGGACVFECNNNSECERDLLCCSDGCGRVCSESVEKCAVSVIV